MVREKREEAHLKSAVQRRVVCCVRGLAELVLKVAAGGANQ